MRSRRAISLTLLPLLQDAQLAQVRREEQEMLETQSIPLRNYLMRHVMPTLTQGLIEVCKVKPDDAVDYLVRMGTHTHTHTMVVCEQLELPCVCHENKCKQLPVTSAYPCRPFTFIAFRLNTSSNTTLKLTRRCTAQYKYHYCTLRLYLHRHNYVFQLTIKYLQK